MTDLSLRERKYAATKAALMEAVLARLATQTLDGVAIREVCAEVQVSETTFYNYFPAKQDVIIYFVQLWSIMVAWEMHQRIAQGGTHLDAVRRMFTLTAERDATTPGVMNEIVAFMARKREPVIYAPLTPAEYAHHFPDAVGIAAYSVRSIDALVLDQLHAAQQAGEIAPEVDAQALAMSLIAVFFVTPVIVAMGLVENAQTAYQRQLAQLLPLPRR